MKRRREPVSAPQSVVNVHPRQGTRDSARQSAHGRPSPGVAHPCRAHRVRGEEMTDEVGRMDGMGDLAEFLLARIAEDEETAKATSGQPWSATVPGMVHADGGFRIKSRYVASVEHGEDRAHIARHDPAHVLAECEAKRRIVEHHTPHRGDDEFPLCSICTEVGPDAQGWPCLTLRLLALPYADHPDFRSEWRA